MNILGQIDASLADFRPRNAREFVALQLARRFKDVQSLPKYLVAAKRFSKRTLLDAAQQARTQHELNRAPIAELFFGILAGLEREGTSP